MTLLDTDTVASILDQFEIDTLYLDDHRYEWLEKFEGHWVVVYDSQLVSHSDTLGSALAEARAKGISGDVAVDRIISEPAIMIL